MVFSFECQGSALCYQAGGTKTRHILDGFASAVPESSAWVLMLIGFAGVGVAARDRKRRSSSPAAKPSPPAGG